MGCYNNPIFYKSAVPLLTEFKLLAKMYLLLTWEMNTIVKVRTERESVTLLKFFDWIEQMCLWTFIVSAYKETIYCLQHSLCISEISFHEMLNMYKTPVETRHLWGCEVMTHF